MSVLDDLAAKLSGNTRAEENTVVTDATTRTYIGTATIDSADGSVYISLGEDVTMPDDYDGAQGTGVEMPTTVAVKEGDEVIVTTVGGSTMKAPVVTGNPGWGDRVERRVTDNETLANEAKAVAEATGQHFWYADGGDGVHITETTQTLWELVPNGRNILINSSGILFRQALNQLLALVTGSNPGMVVYDGKGNSSDNIIASFSGNGYQIGANNAIHQNGTGSAITFYDESGDAVAYVSADKFFAINAEVQDALYVNSYSFREAGDGKLVIGLRS